jgi:hypothetical protein
MTVLFSFGKSLNLQHSPEKLQSFSRQLRTQSPPEPATTPAYLRAAPGTHLRYAWGRGVALGSGHQETIILEAYRAEDGSIGWSCAGGTLALMPLPGGRDTIQP